MAKKNQFGLNSDYGSAMGLRFGAPTQGVNGYNINDYSLNSPQINSPQYPNINNINNRSNNNNGFKDLMGTAAGQFGLDTNYGNTMGLQFGDPIQSVNNGYNLNNYSLNTPQMSSPKYGGTNTQSQPSVGDGLLQTAAGQSGAYGLASGMLNLIPALSDLNKFKKTDPLNTQFQRAQTPEDIEAIKISESQLDPTYNSSLNKTRKDIINLSGGSGAVARANIAGANISNARAKAASLIGIINQNKQQQQSVDKYNAQTRSRIDQLNTGISNKEIEANEQNQAAYNSQLNQYKQTLRQGTSDTMADTLKLFMNMNTTGYGFNGKLKG